MSKINLFKHLLEYQKTTEFQVEFPLEAKRLRAIEARRRQCVERSEVADVTEITKIRPTVIKPIVRTSTKRYHERHPERTRERALARKSDFWPRALEYFEHKCAACGCKQKLACDHWIPFGHSSYPGTVAENIIPLCQRCNSSKSDTPPRDWLRRKFSPQKAAYIMARVDAYCDSVRKRRVHE